ncbi:MAG: hypothetical protein I8H88_06240 [Burkholderiales bacterium]|nr:hypothetical protein [Burkholderiales bacterium]
MASTVRPPAPQPVPATQGLIRQPSDEAPGGARAPRQGPPPEWLRPALALWLQDEGELGVRMGDGHAPLTR